MEPGVRSTGIRSQPTFECAGSDTVLIVAGGLRPDTVRKAIDQLSPDVVDVSSGVESAPGVKDHQQMADFMAAVRA